MLFRFGGVVVFVGGASVLGLGVGGASMSNVDGAWVSRQALVSKLISRLTSATVNGISPGSAGGCSSGQDKAGGSVVVVRRIIEAVMAQIASAATPQQPAADSVYVLDRTSGGETQLCGMS